MGKAKRKRDNAIPEGITPLLAPLQALQALLSEFDDQGVIIGGIAVSLLGAPRFTVDLDAVLLINFAEIPKLLRSASKLGIEPRISDPIPFARKNRVLLLRHRESGIDIDISLGILPFEIEMVERSSVVEVGLTRLRLPTPEDLIILKAVAHRPKDLQDIQAITNSHPDLDKQRVKFWVEQFGEALELPNLWGDIEKLL